MEINDKNGWMVPCHNGYLEFPRQDESQIAVTVWNHIISVKPHRHLFYEFALVTKGYCIHEYQGVKVPLMPGDVFLVMPGEEHGYEIQAPIELINCQFYGDTLSKQCGQLLHELSEKEQIEQDTLRQSQLNLQGIIHLDVQEQKDIEYLLNLMIEEQQQHQEGLMQMKEASIQMILVKFKRIKKRQMDQIRHRTDRKKEKIYEILAYMEAHLAETIDFQGLAEQAHWSIGYFRMIFKDVTGMTPTEYLNRLRILKSLEYMQKDNLNVSEAAERVGYYDPAYYSRLFKKVMGYPPKYFVNIRK